MYRNNNTSSGGLGLGGVLGVIFIVLKLVGVIDWSWWWVLSPFWITFALGILLVIGLYCYYKWFD
jgi:hypothetical protein